MKTSVLAVSTLALFTQLHPVFAELPPDHGPFPRDCEINVYDQSPPRQHLLYQEWQVSGPTHAADITLTFALLTGGVRFLTAHVGSYMRSRVDDPVADGDPVMMGYGEFMDRQLTGRQASLAYLFRDAGRPISVDIYCVPSLPTPGNAGSK